MKLVLAYFLTLICFFAVDLLWLGVIAAPLYSKILGDLFATNPNWVVAILFYCLYILGIFYFAILPGIKVHSHSLAIRNGLLFGFFNYMTYNLTNWAVIQSWPGHLIVIDLPWGIVITGVTASIGYNIYKKLIAW